MPQGPAEFTVSLQSALVHLTQGLYGRLRQEVRLRYMVTGVTISGDVMTVTYTTR